ncbi:MAG TPA: CAP domain-containing protein [Patescibacteria group bacterium]|nr:CAP domain-containing protein [Patescibacteria group bacterium]
MRTLAHLSHFILPGYSNDQKAKLLHSESIFMIVLLMIVAQLFLQFSPSVGIKILGYASSISVDDVVNLTNSNRTNAGAGVLRVNPQLTAAAKAKGEDMLAKDYWAHVAPDGTQPWKFFIDAGYKYKYAGENLAKDFPSAGSAVDAWMASPTHKENLLSTKYDEIGIAVVEGDLNGVDTTIIVQLFGKKLEGSSATTPETVAAKSNENTVLAQAIPSGVPTIAPTPNPTSAELPVFSQNGNISGGTRAKKLTSPFLTTKTLTLLSTGLLVVVFIVDSFVIAKKKLSRYGGKVFAHLAFLGLVLSLAIITHVGGIL